MEARKKVAEDLVLYFGSIIHSHFLNTLEVNEKSRHDFVSDIDKKIEDLFDRFIRNEFPHDTVWGEENAIKPGHGDYAWVIDPLDGTNNYIKGIPQAGVQLAIYKGGHIKFGIIYNPFSGSIYHAEKGKGAVEKNNIHGYTRKMKVNHRPLEESLLIYDSGLAKGEPCSKAIFDEFVGKTGWLRIYGVAVLDLPFLASGSADLLISNIPKPMDIAPGCLLAEEAGAVITDFLGKPWSLFSKALLAGTPANHAEALQLIQKLTTV